MLTTNGLYGHIANNALKSAILMAGFLVLVVIYWWAGCLLWTAILVAAGAGRFRLDFDGSLPAIMDWASEIALQHWMVPVVMTAAWFVCAWLFYRRLIRAATRSAPVERRDEPKLYNLVENLAISAGLPMPSIEIIDSTAMNAYAAGLSPSSATIGVTRGLLDKLPADEL